jgi:hypothetical protein
MILLHVSYPLNDETLVGMRDPAQPRQLQRHHATHQQQRSFLKAFLYNNIIHCVAFSNDGHGNEPHKHSHRITKAFGGRRQCSINVTSRTRDCWWDIFSLLYRQEKQPEQPHQFG